MFSLCTSLSWALPNNVLQTFRVLNTRFGVIFSFVFQTVTVERTTQVIAHTYPDLISRQYKLLLYRMYDIHVHFDISLNLLILEENVLLINQIICRCKLDR
jgi:hypothetical protein